MSATNPFSPPANLHPPQQEQTERKDLEHLKTLSVCHYVWAVLIAFFSFFGFLYIAFGIAVLTGYLPMNVSTPDAPNQPSPEQIETIQKVAGFMMVGMGIALTIIGFGTAFLNYLSGRWLSIQKNRWFSIAIAALNCVSFPIGTVLGVFTLVVLMRQSVANLYEQKKA